MLKQPTKVINTPNSLIPNYLHFTVISVAEVLAPQMPSSKLPESSLVPPALRMAAVPYSHYLCATSMSPFCSPGPHTNLSSYIKLLIMLPFSWLIITSQHKCSPKDANTIVEEKTFPFPKLRKGPDLHALADYPRIFIRKTGIPKGREEATLVPAWKTT